MTTGAGNAVFLDTNILVYAQVGQAPLHQSALDAIQRLYNTEAQLWVSRQVLREYLATLTRPQTFTAPHPIQALVMDVRHFHSRFQVAEDAELPPENWTR